MKKIFAIFSFTLICFYANSQTTCSTAISLGSGNICKDSIVMTDSVLWYSFIPDSPRVSISFSGSLPNSVTVYSGSCNSLNLIQFQTFSESEFISGVYSPSFVPGNTYFLKISGSISLQVSFCLSNKSLASLCPPLFCQQVNDGGFESVLSGYDATYPFSIGDVPCWNAAFGSPNIFVTAPHSGSYYAGMWSNGSSGTVNGEGIYTQVNVINGVSYILDYWEKVIILPGSAASVDNVSVMLGNAGTSGIPGPTVITPVPTIPGLSISTTTGLTSTVWVNRTITFTATGNYNQLIFYPKQNNGSPQSWVGFDDITLTAINTPTASTLAQTICSEQFTSINLMNPAGPLAWTSVASGVTIVGSPSGNGYNIIQQLITTGSTPGTVVYTVTPLGCSGPTLTITVTVNPKPVLTLTTINDESCPGKGDGLITASVTSGTPSYSYYWSTGATTLTSSTTNSINVTGGTYTAYVTDTNGCFTTTQTAVVATLPLFAAPVISGDGTACLSTAYTYTINNYDPALTYSMPVVSPASAYTSISAVSGSGTFTINWTTSGSVTTGGTISVTATAASGCTNTGTFTVYPCCYNEFILVVVNASSSSLPNPYVGGSIIINGTLTINTNFTFKGTDVRMAPGAKIVISPAGGPKTLTLTNNGATKCYVHAGCNVMWDQISVGANQTLVVENNTRIEDADSAIVSENGGKYTITNSELNRNLKHIVVRNYSGTHPGTISKSSLNCRAYPTAFPANLIAPYSSRRTLIGMEIYDVKLITIGNGSSVPATNYFSQMDIGIRSARSSLQVFNNTFGNIDNPTSVLCKTCDCQVGTAICSKGGKGVPYTLIVAGGGLPPIINKFINGVNGVFAKDNMNVFVDDNTFNTLSGTGVFVTQCPFRTLDVSRNKMDNVRSGIDIYEDQNAFSTLIDDNRFNLGAGTSISNYAIVIQNVMLNPNNATITNNNIQRSNTGIWLINSDGTQAWDNRVDFLPSMLAPTAKLYGIRLEKSNNSKIESNDIYKSTGPPPTAAQELILRGISVENSQNCLVATNRMIQIGQGIRMLNSCNNATLACNSMALCRVGIKFDAANVGNQLPGGIAQRNIWSSTVGPYNMTGAIFPAIQFWWLPGVGTNPGSIAGFTASSFVPGHPMVTTNTTNICGSFHPIIGPGPGRNQKFGDIVRDLMVYSINPVEFKFADKTMTYQALRKDNSLIVLGEPDDSVYQNFYANVSSSPLGKFTEVNELINVDDITTATSVNNAVVPTTVMETNRQVVNEIYLRTFALWNQNLSADDESTLLAIATLDPLMEGDAVYSARSMLRIDPTNPTAHSMEALPEETIAEKNSASKIYPNPNNGVMQMDYQLSEQATGQLTIFDITGRVVSSYLLSGQEGSNTLQIDETKLKPGIYFYRVNINDQIIDSDKIVIVK